MKLDFSPTSNTKIHIFNKYLFSFCFFNYISSIVQAVQNKVMRKE